MTDEKNDMIVFLDTVGRTIIGKRLEEDETTIRVQNPAVVNIVPQQAVGPNGEPVQRMALQLFPVFFREFLAAKDEPIKFTFNKKSITLADGDTSLDFKVTIQYDQLFSTVGTVNATAPVAGTPPTPAAQPQKSGDDNVIKLFD